MVHVVTMYEAEEHGNEFRNACSIAQEIIQAIFRHHEGLPDESLLNMTYLHETTNCFNICLPKFRYFCEICKNHNENKHPNNFKHIVSKHKTEGAQLTLQILHEHSEGIPYD